MIDDKKIVSFKRLDTKHQINIDTDATFDLYCTCDDDSRVIVECQNGSDAKEFKNRALAYSAMAILDQAHNQWLIGLERGEHTIYEHCEEREYYGKNLL